MSPPVSVSVAGTNRHPRYRAAGNIRSWSGLAGSLIATAVAGLAWGAMVRPRPPALVFIGTQGQGRDEGIQAASFDEATGRMRSLGLAAAVERPTWLVSSPGRHRLYAVSEVGNTGDRQGEVLSFAIAPTGSRLLALYRTSSGGGGATHLVMNRRQDTLFVANFGGGSVAAYVVAPNGMLTAAGPLQATAGAGPHRRQGGPHPHGVTLDPSGRFLLVPDMGADRVFVFRLHRVTRRLSPALTPALQMPPGTGPRLLLFGGDRRICYLLSELSAELFVLRWNAVAGTLHMLARVALDAPDAEHAPSAAALLISRDGRRLYASNRGTHQIQVYAIHHRSGLLTEIQRVDAGGLKPWSATFSPSGSWLLIANQGSNAVSVFKIDADGRLVPSAGGLSVSLPTSIAFARRRAGGCQDTALPGAVTVSQA